MDPTPDITPPIAPPDPTAGPAWCALYPPSRSVSDLVPAFRRCVESFITELHRRRCTVTITSTRRPEQRAWLMHYAWDVAHGTLRPDEAPARADIPIVWTVEGAHAMVDTYRLAYRPALTSRHIEGRSIDMSIAGWPGTLPDLYALGKAYGVKKLVTDPPHWSDDGR